MTQDDTLKHQASKEEFIVKKIKNEWFAAYSNKTRLGEKGRASIVTKKFVSTNRL